MNSRPNPASKNYHYDHDFYPFGASNYFKEDKESSNGQYVNFTLQSYIAALTAVQSKQKELEEKNIALDEKIQSLKLILEGDDGLIAKINDANEKVSSTDKRTLQILGLFFTLFALISTSVQILTQVTNLFQAFSLITLIAFILILFLTLLFLYTHENKNVKLYSIVALSMLSLILIIGTLSYLDKSNTTSFIPECSKQNIDNSDCIIRKEIIDKLVSEKVDDMIDTLQSPITKPE